MKRYYVRFANIPMKFLQMAGKDIASQVSVDMATKFDTQDLAYLRALAQWGDNAMEHVEICTVGAPHPADRRERSKPDTSKVITDNQAKLL